MCTIWIEEVDLCKEAQFVSISNVSVIFVLRPEESIALVPGIEPVPDVCADDVLS